MPDVAKHSNIARSVIYGTAAKLSRFRHVKAAVETLLIMMVQAAQCNCICLAQELPVVSHKAEATIHAKISQHKPFLAATPG
jgi:hypothetical protein